MARPKLPIGTHGKIAYVVATSGAHIARTFYRDADGTTRQVQRTGRTQALARSNLLAALQTRSAVQGGSGLSADSSFREASEVCLAGIVHTADTGELSPDTAQLYSLQLRNHVLPALGTALS